MEHWLNLSRYPAERASSARDVSGWLSDQPVTSCVLHKALPIQFSDPRVKFADMNGDGLEDIVLVDYGQLVLAEPATAFGAATVGGQYGESVHRWRMRRTTRRRTRRRCTSAT
jgi:hypothetical protein